LKVDFNIRKGTPMRRLISRPPLTFALAAATLLGACDGDTTPNQTGTAGSSAGTGGAMGGSGGAAGGTGGSPVGSGGTGGGVGGTGGAGGGTAGTGGTAAAFTDTDGVFARFNADGTPDTTFGTNGVVRVDFGPGALVGTNTVRDAPWGIAKDAQDRLHMFAMRKNVDGRTDTDRCVARLSANGVLDTTFGDAVPMQSVRTGFHTLNVSNLSDSVRNGIVQPDGKIVTAGYTSQPTYVGPQSANAVIVARLHGGDAPATGGSGGGGTGGAGGAAGAAGPIPGTYDTTFGVNGFVNRNPFASNDGMTMWGMAEAYGVARQSTGAYVTTGYGRLAPSGQVNVVSFRFTAAGAFDTTWATNGIFEKDITSADDRGRNIIALPDDRLLIAGSSVPATGNIDAMVMILTPNGALDTTFNTTGYKIYKVDPASDRTDEAFFGAAMSPNGMFAAVAGYRNAPTPVTTTVNDDAVLAIIPIGGTGTEFVGVVPFSATANDRAWAVTFDADNKVVIAGYVAEGTDHWMAVARFNTDGTRDATFGTGGIAKINAAVAGNLEEARGVVVQSTGKIVVGGTVEH
jgi:uncharacterized delta-60 repeat protein